MPHYEMKLIGYRPVYQVVTVEAPDPDAAVDIAITAAEGFTWVPDGPVRDISVTSLEETELPWLQKEVA